MRILPKHHFSAAISIAFRYISRRSLPTLLTVMALTLTITGFILTVTISEDIGFQVTTDYSERTFSTGSETGFPFFCDIVVTSSNPWWDKIRQSTTLVTEDQFNQINELYGYNWSEPYIGDLNIIFERSNENIKWNIKGKDGIIKSSKSNIWIAGLDFNVEELRLRNKFVIMEGENFNDLKDGVAIGYEFAKQNKIHVGDTIIIPANNMVFNTRPGKAFLSGERFRGIGSIIDIFSENSWDVDLSFNLEETLTLKVDSVFWSATPYDNFIFVNYIILQKSIIYNERMTCIFLKLNQDTEIDEFLNKIWSIEGVEAFIPTIKKEYINTKFVQTAQTFSEISPTRFTKISNLQTLIVSGFATIIFMASTCYTIIYKRRWEIGLLKSIGFKPSFIITMLLIEPLILGVVAGLSGFMLACLISILSGGLTVPVFGNVPLLSTFIPQINIEPLFMWGATSLMVSILISVISGFIPAYLASRLTPIDAMGGEID